MADNLAEALDRLQLASNMGSETTEDEEAERFLSQQARPRANRRHDPVALKAELEKKYLSPSTAFSTEWLNRLQQ